jgi:hypothetical protein
VAFAPTLADIVRTSSGVLWVGLGVALLLRPRQAAEARWLGAFLALMFGGLIAGNVVVMIHPLSQRVIDLEFGVESVFDALAALVLVLFLRSELRRGHASARRALLLSIACALAADALVLVEVPSLGTPKILSLLPKFALIGGVSWHVTERAISAGARTPLLYLAAIACYPLAYANEVMLFQDGPGITAISIVLLTTAPALVTIVALFRARTKQGRAAPVLGAFLIATGLTALLVRSLGNGDYDVRGPARIVAFGFLVAAGLRLGWLGDISPRSRGAFVATIALPALLVVAQVAQNFLSAQYGLLMGGIVAGALLVAARPIERALEGRNAIRRAPSSPDDRARRIYRDAVRHALRDRAMTRAEEMHLTELAEELSIPASDALRIRHEVEDETQGSDGSVSHTL